MAFCHGVYSCANYFGIRVRMSIWSTQAHIILVCAGAYLFGLCRRCHFGVTTTTTTTTTALFSPQMLKIIIVYSRFTQLQIKEDHGHPKIAGASRVK